MINQWNTKKSLFTWAWRPKHSLNVHQNSQVCVISHQHRLDAWNEHVYTKSQHLKTKRQKRCNIKSVAHFVGWAEHIKEQTMMSKLNKKLHCKVNWATEPEWKSNIDMNKFMEMKKKTHTAHVNQPPCVCMSTVLRAWRAQPGPEGIERSSQCKQRPLHNLRCLLAAKRRGLHILKSIIAFCSFSINLTW